MNSGWRVRQGTPKLPTLQKWSYAFTKCCASHIKQAPLEGCIRDAFARRVTLPESVNSVTTSLQLDARLLVQRCKLQQAHIQRCLGQLRNGVDFLNPASMAYMSLLAECRWPACALLTL